MPSIKSRTKLILKSPKKAVNYQSGDIRKLVSSEV